MADDSDSSCAKPIDWVSFRQTAVLALIDKVDESSRIGELERQPWT